MRIAYLTNCTARKAISPHITLAGVNPLTPESWMKAVQSCDNTVLTADRLYQGVAFELHKANAKLLGAVLYIASAGVGCVHANDYIPSYDASLSKEGEGAKVRDYYKGSKLSWLKGLGGWTQLQRYDFVIVAVSATYLPFVAKLVPNGIFITSSKVKVDHVFKYDRSINDPNSGYSGGDVTLIARAAKHYCENLFPATSSRQISFTGCVEPPAPIREGRVSDDELRAWLGENAIGLGSHQALQKLRNSGIGCKPARFRKIFNAMKEGQIDG